MPSNVWSTISTKTARSSCPPGFMEEQIPKASTPHEQEFLQQAIDTADKQVDMLVCESYCLTADGIQIVERRSR